MSRTKVEYWEKWSGQEWQAMASLVQAFNAEQEAYEVVMTPTGDRFASPDLGRFLRAQGEGAPPDLVGLEDHHLADLADQGGLAPLDRLVAPPLVRAAGFREAFLELGRHDELLCGLPIATDIVTLYANQESLVGTRFEGGSVPPDIDAFDEGLEELRRRGQIGLVPTYPGWWPQAWPWLFGGGWFDEAGRFAPDQPANVRAYEWVASFRKRWDLSEFAEPIQPIGSRKPDPFLSGRVAFVLEGDWLVQRLVTQLDFDWTPAPIPTARGKPAALLVADLLCIPTGARSPEGAASFLSFLLEPERIERLALGQTKISPLVSWSSGFLAAHTNPRLTTLREILDSAVLFHDPRVPGWLAVLERIQEAFGLIWSGKDSPSSVLARLSSGRR